MDLITKKRELHHLVEHYILANFTVLLYNGCMCSWGETSPRFIWMGGFTPCTSLRAVHGATHGWHVSDVPDTYTITEQAIDKYEPQQTQTVTLRHTALL